MLDSYYNSSFVSAMIGSPVILEILEFFITAEEPNGSNASHKLMSIRYNGAYIAIRLDARGPVESRSRKPPFLIPLPRKRDNQG